MPETRVGLGGTEVPQTTLRVHSDSVPKSAVQKLQNASERQVDRGINSIPSHSRSVQDSLQAAQVYPYIPINKIYEYAFHPPAPLELLSSISDYDIPQKIYRDPHYSLTEDVPEHPMEYGGLVYALKNDNSLDTLGEWQNTWIFDRQGSPEISSTSVLPCCWEYSGIPPSVRLTRQWLKRNNHYQNALVAKDQSQASLLMVFTG